MDKRTVYAIIISTIIIIVGFSIQRAFLVPQSDEEASGGPAAEAEELASSGAENQQSETIADTALAAGVLPIIDAVSPPRCNPRFNNGTVEVLFSEVDGGIESFKLLDHLYLGQPIDLIFKGDTTQNPFTIFVGGDGNLPLRGAYSCSSTNEKITFSGRFIAPTLQAEPFDVFITYRFAPDEYFFQQDIEFRNSVNKPIPLNPGGGGTYTLFIGPQIGPEFAMLDNRAEYRKYVTLNGRDKDTKRLNGRRKKTLTVPRGVKWAAIVGKYFALIAIPNPGVEEIFISAVDTAGVPAASEMFLRRAPIQSSAQVDVYQFYFGPKQRREFNKYDSAEGNAFGVADLNLKKVQDSRPLLGWLEAILKAMLTLIYAVVPNYGISIIILTIVVKLALTPLTSKSQRSMERLQALSPKIKELREQYTNDRQRLNVEMAKLYKRENVNPAGGCLPLLLQMPFFLAMFGIFNNHFELRNAIFISGWIDDLSMPESILNFGTFVVPILGWNDLRLLPILYAITQLISAYLSRNPAQATQQAKMMMFLMPIMLFFILYNLPSGLLVYWVATNMLMIIQQSINRAKRNRKAKGNDLQISSAQ